MSRPGRSIHAPVRALPLRVPLGDGEALDSWLLRLAHRNGIPARWLLEALGMADRIRVWHNHALVRRVPAELLRRIEAQTGLPARELDRAVLDRYEPLGWTPIVGSRYCTRCLAESDVWPIHWQLPYTFACTRHRCLLAEVCPACARAPRSGLSRQCGLLPSHRCSTRPRPQHDVCGGDLLTHRTRWLRPGDPRLAVQEWINQRLDVLDDAAFTELADLDTIAIWFRQRLEPRDLAHLGKSTMDAFAEYRSHRHSTRRRQPVAPVVAAAIAAQAVGLLTAADDHERYQRFAPLFRDFYTSYQPGATPPRAPMILSHRRMTGLSAPLRHRLLAACDPHLPISERLRYRTCISTPHLPEPGSTVAADRARHIPQYLWHDWIIRFLPRTGLHVHALATDIAAALLIPGNPVRNVHATGELNPWTQNTSQTLRTLSEHQRDALTAICALAEYLDSHGSPICYRRRRATFTDIDLTQPQWEDLCASVDAHPGGGARQRHARRYLFHLLTGADLANPRHPVAFSNSSDRNEYLSGFQRNLESPLRAALHQHAQAMLAAAGIDEPLTWSPPADCVAGLHLPGRHPDHIDTNLLRRLILIEDVPASVAARRLGVSAEHVRYATQRLDRPARPHPTHSPPAARRNRELASRTLTAEFFQREYTDAGKTVATIAAETGLSSKLVSRHARQLGIPLTAPHRRASIDPAWLREQTQTLRRTNVDIATELGLTHETIRRYRSNLRIPARRTGTYSDRRHPDLPRDIRRAVEGQRGGWQRLRRFQQMMAYPSMNTAAAALGLHTQNLNLQLQRLETDIGTRLLHRAPHRYAPMAFTRRGGRLIEDLNRPDVIGMLDRYADANTRSRGLPTSGRRA